MRRWSMVSVEEVRCVSTSSAAELTLITSCVPATARLMGISAICPTVMATSVTVALPKPGGFYADRIASRRQQQDAGTGRRCSRWWRAPVPWSHPAP